MPDSSSKQSIPRRRARAENANTLSGSAGKPGQRERLIQATIGLAAEKSLGEISVADLAARAGVSRSAVYSLFGEKEECFVAAYKEVSRRVLREIERAARASAWPEAPSAALRAQLDGLAREPATGWLLMVEGMAGPPQVRSARKKLLERFEGMFEGYLEHPTRGALTLDVPAIALAGGVRAVVTRRLGQHEADQLPALHHELLGWISSYARPTSQPRWSVSPKALLSPPAISARAPNWIEREPLSLPRGNHALPASAVAREHRTRLVQATAEVAMDKGYREMRVTDIVTRAGVSRDVFYVHFQDKLDAFIATQQRTVQEIATAGTARFFSARTWPERVWEGMTVLTEGIAQDPAGARLAVVESFAAGRAANERLEATMKTATIFLEEGYHQSARAHALPRLFTEAIVGAIFEIVYHHVAHGDPRNLPLHLPILTYVAIAPFTGTTKAVKVIEAIREAHPTK